MLSPSLTTTALGLNGWPSGGSVPAAAFKWPVSSPLAFPAGRAPGFDPTHPAAQNCVPVRGFSAIPAHDVAYGYRSLLDGMIPADHVAISGSAVGVIDGYIGPGQKTVNSLGLVPFVGPIFHTLPTSVAVNSTTVETIAAIIHYVPTPTRSGNFAILNTADANNDTGISHGLCLNTTSASAPAKIGWIVTDSGSVVQAASNFSLPQGTYFIVCSCSLNGSNGPVYFVAVDLTTGQIFSDFSQTTTVASASLRSRFTIGAMWSPPSLFNGGIYGPVMYAQNFLNPQQLLRWAADPWSFWYPKRDLLFPYAGSNLGVIAPSVSNISANQTIPAFSQTAALKALAKIAASQQIPAFSQTAALKALEKLAANQVIPDFSQTAAARVIAKIVANQQIPDFGQSATLTNSTPRHISANQVIPPFDQTFTLHNFNPRDTGGGGIRRMSRGEIEAMRKREREIEQLQTELREGTKDAVMAALGSGPIAEDDALVALLLSMI